MSSEELVPIDKVLDDMYNDYSAAQAAARDYYYQHYATPEEQAEMNHEDKVIGIIAYVFSALVIAGLLSGIIMQLI